MQHEVAIRREDASSVRCDTPTGDMGQPMYVDCPQ